MVDFSKLTLAGANISAKADTDEQVAVKDVICDDSVRAFACEALAGTGKTTTIIGGGNQYAGVVKYYSFGNDAVAEIVSRGVPAKSAVTLHSTALKVLASYTGAKQFIDKSRLYNQTIAAINDSGLSKPLKEYISDIMGVIKFSKARGFVPKGFAGVSQMSERDLKNLIISNGIISEEIDVDDVLDICLTVLTNGAELDGNIDFSDMVWLPYVHQMPVSTEADLALIDEAQDMDITQLYVATNRGNRVGVIGDRFQAIYGWRGADINNFGNTIKSLEALVLPMTINWRCGNSIIKEAKRFVPAIQAAPNAIDGTVGFSTLDDMYTNAEIGDFIISRTNAPLFKAWIEFTKRGKPAYVLGDSIGEQLSKLTQKFIKTKLNDSAFETYFREWAEEKAAKVIAEGLDGTKFFDIAHCLVVLHREAKTAEKLLVMLKHIMTERGVSNSITLGSTHRMKGREAKRVFRLNNFSSRTQEEVNLSYVSVTRAKEELIYVGLDNGV